jgi:hypothetical protein
MATFGFFVDSNLTQPILNNYSINEGTSDFRFYLGGTSASVKLQDASSPGINSMYISIEDTILGSGPEKSWITLSLTQSGLSTAIAGESLNIGSTVLGGTASALPFWVRISNRLSGVSSSTDLFLKITGVKEFAV